MKDNTFNYTVEQFADLQLLRYRVPDFEHLSLQAEETGLLSHRSRTAWQGYPVRPKRKIQFADT